MGVLLTACTTETERSGFPIYSLTDIYAEPNLDSHGIVWLRATLISDSDHYWILVDTQTDCVGFAATFIGDAYAKWIELESLDNDRPGVAISGEFLGEFLIGGSDVGPRFAVHDYRAASVRSDIDLGGEVRFLPCE